MSVKDKVFPKQDAVVRVGKAVVNPLEWPIPYVVESVEGEWLQIGTDRKGWILQSDVVTLHEAPRYYAQLMRSVPTRIWALLLRASVWKAKGVPELAITDLDAILRQVPNAVVYHNRGNMWNSMKQYTKAIADYDKALQLNPKFAPSYEGRGRAWFAQKEYDRAIADYDEALRLDPNQSSTFYFRSLAWYLKEDFERSLEEIEQFILLNPKESAGYNVIAWIKSSCPDARYRNGTLAVKNAVQACELSDWKDPYNLGTLGTAYAEVGDFDSAIDYQQRAILANPTEGDFIDRANRRLTLYFSKQPFRDE